MKLLMSACLRIGDWRTVSPRSGWNLLRSGWNLLTEKAICDWRRSANKMRGKWHSGVCVFACFKVLRDHGPPKTGPFVSVLPHIDHFRLHPKPLLRFAIAAAFCLLVAFFGQTDGGKLRPAYTPKRPPSGVIDLDRRRSRWVGGTLLASGARIRRWLGVS